jgi:glycine/D-amino acid oxidase-like deaminating enzyme
MANARLVQRQQALIPGLKGEPPRSGWPASVASGFKPVIGRSPRHANVFFAFGHDHLGLTMAGITGKLVAELATGKPTSVDLRRSVPTVLTGRRWASGTSAASIPTSICGSGLGVTLAYSLGTVLGGSSSA